MKKLQKIYLVSFLIGSMLTSVLFVQGQSTNSKTLFNLSNAAQINQFSAGDDVTICSNDDFVTQGTTNVAGTTFWFTNGDGAFNNPFSLNAVYSPGEHDIANGMVTLTMNILPQVVSLNQLQDEVVINISDCLSYSPLED